tara:strand:+ start:1367 stop:1666 length:300 start_codon:yes stop_codon:yes gene_type:complete
MSINQQFNNINPNSLVLPDIYNDCIIDYDGCRFVYCAKCIIDKLTKEFIEAIKEQELELYNDQDSIGQSAYTYAVEHFEFNFLNCIGKYYPIYKYKDQA